MLQESENRQKGERTQRANEESCSRVDFVVDFHCPYPKNICDIIRKDQRMLHQHL